MGGHHGLLRRLRTAVVLGVAAAAVSLVGCASDKPKPTPLSALTPKIAGRQVWQAKLDGARFPLGIVSVAGQYVVAGDDGTVLALDAATGREVWRGQAGAKLAAGVGSDGRFAAVVTAQQELVVLDRGQPAWRARLGARTLTPPLVAGERVFVMSVDRVVRAFDALDGRRLWTFQRPGDPLGLAQPGVVSAFRDTLVVGQGPRMVGLDSLKGTVVWDVAVANPRGTNEVERLAELVGPAARQGNALCVRAFQSAVGCVAGERGTLQWARNVGGSRAVGADEAVVVAGDASDRLTAWKRANGDLAWTNESFLHRELGGMVVTGKSVVFGDAQGMVHFLDRDSGEPVLRLPTDGSAIAGAPALSGTTLLVATRAGGLFAFRPE